LLFALLVAMLVVNFRLAKRSKEDEEN